MLCIDLIILLDTLRMYKMMHKKVLLLKTHVQTYMFNALTARSELNGHNKANLRDLIAATGLVILPKIRFKSSIFQPV